MNGYCNWRFACQEPKTLDLATRLFASQQLDQTGAPLHFWTALVPGIATEVGSEGADPPGAYPTNGNLTHFPFAAICSKWNVIVFDAA